MIFEMRGASLQSNSLPLLTHTPATRVRIRGLGLMNFCWFSSMSLTLSPMFVLVEIHFSIGKVLIKREVLITSLKIDKVNKGLYWRIQHLLSFVLTRNLQPTPSLLAYILVPLSLAERIRLAMIFFLLLNLYTFVFRHKATSAQWLIYPYVRPFSARLL